MSQMDEISKDFVGEVDGSPVILIPMAQHLFEQYLSEESPPRMTISAEVDEGRPALVFHDAPLSAA